MPGIVAKITSGLSRSCSKVDAVLYDICSPQVIIGKIPDFTRGSFFGFSNQEIDDFPFQIA